jgi:hypothetical protein
MKIYISGPPVDKIGEGDELHAIIYKIIRETTAGKHAISLPIRTIELQKLDPKGFFDAISNKIKIADGVISVVVHGDQSTPVESTLAALNGKPQSVLEIGPAPRLLRGLPNIVEIVKVNPKDVQSQVQSVVQNLIKLIEPDPEPLAL